MRGLVVAAALGASAALGAGLVACFDLFHSTADVLTACEIDAARCLDAGGDAAALADAGPTDFCTWTPSAARLNAQHACAWLGACETPMGRNAFGACMFQALLAYDCEANPNHPVKGRTLALWDCLWQVKTCPDVDACLLPDGPARCPTGSSFSACGTGSDAMPTDPDVRFECADAGPTNSNASVENCALWGKTCAQNGIGAACAGPAGLSCGNTKACVGQPRATLQWCVDGGDLGTDCARNGGQFCVGFPDAGDPWLACAAEGAGGACDPDPSASCADGVAYSCPTGVLERIDCASLLRSDSACTAGALVPPFDWTSPCAVTPASCTESCAGGLLTGCERGASFAVDCAAENLGPCHMVETDVGSAQHPACAAP